MNETPDPRQPDDELVEALGDALREAPDDLVIPPPVADIAERAAAKARARNTRRTVGSIAASVMLVAGGVVAWNVANDSDPDEQEVAIESSEEPATEAAVDSALADEAATSEMADVPVRPLIDVDPAEYSTAPSLQWTEISGPAEGSGSLMTLPDGRVMVRLWSNGGTDQVLVTADGETWEPVALPADISPNVVDLGDALWVVTGWDSAATEFGDAVYVSSDQGASWQKLDVPGLGQASDDYLVTRSYLGAAAAFGDQVVVATSSFTELDMEQIAIDQGIASSAEQVVGWGSSSDENGTTTITIDIGNRSDIGLDDEDEPFQFETFEFTPEELGLPDDLGPIFSGPDTDTFTILAGNADGLSPVAELDGSPSRMVVGDGVVAMSGFTPEGPALWTSVDAATWTEVDAGDGFELGGEFQGDLWGGGWSPEGFAVQRLGAGGVETVAAFPGLNLNNLLSVGPSGLASTVSADFQSFEEPFPVESIEGDEFLPEGSAELPPGVMATKDGIELRVEEDGTGTLVDTNSGEVLREFSEAEMNADEVPAGVIELDDGTDFSLRIQDPVTGEELVTFSVEDYAQFGLVPNESGSSGFSVDGGSETLSEGDFFEAGEGTSFIEGEFQAPENWLAWSANGVDWNFQRATEAFGVAEDEEAWTQLAVGDGYVVAMIETFTPEAETFEGDAEFFPTVRWFIAQAG